MYTSTVTGSEERPPPESADGLRPRARWARLGPALASALLALALYAVTLWGTYVYDDIIIARDDARLHDPARWGEYWTTAYFKGGLDNLYRPLVSLSFAVQWWLHGDKPWAMHAVNWLLHGAASALVAELALRLAGPRRPGARFAAYAAGLLFAAHPVHVEVAANLVGRAELMCALGVLGALVLMARPPLTAARAAGAYLSFGVALLSKEQGMLTPLLMLMMFGVARFGADAPEAPDARDSLRGPDDARARERRRTVALLLVFFVCATLAAYIVYRESILRFWWDRSKLDWMMNPLVLSRGPDRWVAPVAVVGRCAALLVAPVKLSVDYGTVISPTARWHDPYLWLGFASILLWLVLLAVSVLRRAWAAAFCLVAFAALYGMVSNFMSLIGTVFAERTLYLPSAFFLVLVGLGAARLQRPAARRAAATALAVLLALGSVRTVTYAHRWNDRLAFYEAALLDQPGSHQIHLLAANEKRVLGDYAGAERILEQARASWPDSDLVHVYSGMVALERGDLDAADRYADRAMSLKPSMDVLSLSQQIAERRAQIRSGLAPSTR